MDYDVLVIGSGFGGSVTALRLTEKGYRVGILEAGQRFDETTYPKTSWSARRYIWAPALGCYGMLRIKLLRDVMIFCAAGVGGGSLIYANTLYEPLKQFYDDPQWAHITDWRSELAPYYDQAKRMLGVVENPLSTDADRVMKEIAEDMGVGDTFHPTPVGVYFGGPGVAPGTDVPDPFFGGAGPARTTCVGCGECMTGCRHNAKNTLMKNYLYLAEQAGAEVHPLTTVTAIRELPDGSYAVDTRRTNGKVRRERRTFTAGQVVVAAGTYNTQKLLHRMRDDGVLPRISGRLGLLTRTNSESIQGVQAKGRDVDFSKGIAITSSFHPDAQTHVEPARYGKGSNALALIGTAMSEGGDDKARWRTWARAMASNPRQIKAQFWVRGWSERSIIVLVMQSLDNSITVYGKRTKTGRYKLTSRQGHGAPNPTWIPVAGEVTKRAAEKMDGDTFGSLAESVADIPATAHFIGGCAIGDSPETGVIDPYHRLYGHPGIHVVDGSAISANLGVNPSLTITAQAERAMSFWPNKGERDERPELGAAYRRLAPVAPKNPVVPDSAPGALRLLPITPV